MPPYKCINPSCGKQGKVTAAAKCLICTRDNQDLAAPAASSAAAAPRLEDVLAGAEHPSAAAVFAEVRARLGTPLNDPKWKNSGNTKADEATLGEAYNACKKGIGISENDQERNSSDAAVRETWMVRSAALGWVLRAGVCNSFGALTAILLRLREVEAVRMVGTDAHNWADYGPHRVSVDAWLHERYAVTSPRNETSAIVELTRPPEHYWRRLSEAIQDVRSVARRCHPAPALDLALPEPPGMAPKASSGSSSMAGSFKSISGAQKADAENVGLFEAGLRQTHTLVDTLPDGNCLFRALSVGLYGHQDQHGALRSFAVGDMRHNPAEYTPYGIDAAYTTVMIHMAAGADDVARWGGGPEIYAVSRIFHRRIIVHSPIFASGQLVFGDTREGGADVHVYYKGRNHYVGMRRA
jgi:OTU-like cysteine protease